MPALGPQPIHVLAVLGQQPAPDHIGVSRRSMTCWCSALLVLCWCSALLVLCRCSASANTLLTCGHTADPCRHTADPAGTLPTHADTLPTLRAHCWHHADPTYPADTPLSLLVPAMHAVCRARLGSFATRTACILITTRSLTHYNLRRDVCLGLCFAGASGFVIGKLTVTYGMPGLWYQAFVPPYAQGCDLS